jgi:hypothetical protein
VDAKTREWIVDNPDKEERPGPEMPPVYLP